MIAKKAVSPLIATVLLIAFAVALGAVVMNWSFKYAPSVNTCESITLQFETLQNRPDICFDPAQNTVKFTLRNGNTQLKGIKAIIIGSQGSYDLMQEIDFNTNDIKKFGVRFEQDRYGIPQKLIIQPILMQSDGLNICYTNSIASEHIPSC